MPTIQFKGKNIIWNHHLAIPYHTLDEVPELDFANAKSKDNGNIIIEGDNLTALKALIPVYGNSVQCIYIDPPYNTGNDNGTNKGWIYNDNVNSPLLQEWFKSTVSKEDMTRHDKWLCMMTPRIKLLHDLLKPEGVIFISIDDNEVHHLRNLMNEIFGEENFIASLIWNTGRKSIAKLVATNHEYCLVYAKNKNKQVAEEVENGNGNGEASSKLWRERKKGLEPIYEKYEELKKKFKDDYKKISAGLTEFFNSLSDDNPTKAHDHYDLVDENGVYFPGDISQGTGDGGRFDILHPVTKKPCKVPAGGWRFNEKNLPDILKAKLIHFGADENTIPCLKRYLNKTEFEVPSSVFYRDARGAKKRLKALFDGKDVFTFPKDEEIIKKFIGFCTQGEDIVLDSFGGSGTTAQAVLDLNKADGGNRKFILVQMPESTEEEPKKNICKDVTRERVKRVIQKQDYKTGFKYLKVGIAIDAENMLEGNLPTYLQFAKYVFYLCTGENLSDTKAVDAKKYFVGKHGSTIIYLVYEKDYDKLTRLALNLTLAEQIRKDNPKKKVIVYAPACFLDEEYLEEHQIQFVSIPYNLFQRNN